MKTTELLPTTFENVEAVRIANKSIGQHWFDKETMRWFRSQVNGADKLINKRFFISSEQMVYSNGKSEPRKYTIRIASQTGEVDTYGEFQAYATRKQAIAAAHKIALPVPAGWDEI